MKNRPEGLTDTELVTALARGWRLAVRELTYQPVGAGSYHWIAVDDNGSSRLVTVDDLGAVDAGRDAGFDTLRRALGTAQALHRDAGLDFVVAPLPTRSGAAVWRIDPRYAASVFPMVDGVAGAFGAHRPEDRVVVAGLLARLHGATALVAEHAPRAELVLPGRNRLDDALGDLDREWRAGPYAEPARRLLADRAERVTRLLGDFDGLVARVRATATEWVVTHGEPHPGNLIRTPDGPRLIDWETVRLAPPERDLWLVAGAGAGGVGAGAGSGAPPAGSDEALASYVRATGRRVDPAGLALYRLWWELADIASFVDDLRRPHRATADSTAALAHLRGYLG